MNVLSKFFKGDKTIWAILFFLCALSIVEVLSAGSKLTYKTMTVGDFFSGHAIKVFIGIGITIVFSLVPWRYFKVLPLPYYAFSLICLILTLIMGESTNGASRSLFGIFQPSELMKGAVIIMESSILAFMLRPDGKNTEKNAIWPILITAGLACAFIVTENLSTAVLLFGVVVLLMFVGRVPMRQLLILLGSIFGAACLFLLFLLSLGSAQTETTTDDTEERIELVQEQQEKVEKKGVFSSVLHRASTWSDRIKSAMNNRHKRPVELDYLGKDMQSVHAGIAICNSNVIGRGPGHSIERDRLDQAYSDFIYAIIIEELGLEGGLFVVILYLLLLWRCIQLAKYSERAFPAYLMVGLALLITAQAMMNMFVAVGLMPVTGQTLPFISRGGTATLVMGFYFGIILSISRYCLRCKKRQLEAQKAAIAA